MNEKYTTTWVENHFISNIRIRKILKSVLLQLPEELKEHLSKLKAIILADGSFPKQISNPHPPSNEDICDPEQWIIILDGRICEESDAYIKGVIAHELAHFVLRSNKSHGELDADNLAINWGFSNEIKLVQNNRKCIEQLDLTWF